MDLHEYATEIHRPARLPSQYRKVVVPGNHHTLGLDLVDMTDAWVDKNDGYRYIFVCVDIFSRYAYAIPLKTKDAKSTWAAMQSVLDEVMAIPKKLWSDAGAEFYNATWKAELKKLKVTLYSTHGKDKVSIVERFNRTLKTSMWRRFSEYNTRRWVDMLSDLLSEYNDKVHSALGMSPRDASNLGAADEKKLWKHQYGSANAGFITKPKFKLDEWVRVSRLKGAFEKGFHGNWSYQIYQIKSINIGVPITYMLADYNGAPVSGSWYENELQKSSTKDVFLIDHVIKDKTVKGKKQYLVRWLGWGPKFDSWVDAKDMMQLPK